MTKWYSPQSRQFNDLVRALRNAFAMLGVMFVAVVAAGWFSK